MDCLIFEFQAFDLCSFGRVQDFKFEREGCRNVRRRHCLRSVFMIVRENQLVVKYEDAAE